MVLENVYGKTYWYSHGLLQSHIELISVSKSYLLMITNCEDIKEAGIPLMTSVVFL